MKEDRFTLFSGEVTYSGEAGVFCTGDGNFTLNGRPMAKQEKYTLMDGDIIRDLNYKPTHNKGGNDYEQH